MRPLITSVAIFMCHSGFTPHAQPAQEQGASLAARIAPAILAGARLGVDETWRRPLDALVQNAPAAASLGSRWTPESPGWQKARASVAARVTRIIDAYVKSNATPRLLEAELARMFPGASAAALESALDGPAGAAIVQYQARTEFIAEMMSATPNGPQPGDPAWMQQFTALGRTFTEHVGAAVPRDDGTHTADAVTFVTGPAGRAFAELWMTVAGKARVAIDGAINLMLFDDREAINRDIAAAVATIRNELAR